MTPVPPPKADPLDAPDTDRVVPHPRDDLVVGLMEVRDYSKPKAEEWIDEHGRECTTALLRARWTFPERDRWSGGGQ